MSHVIMYHSSSGCYSGFSLSLDNKKEEEIVSGEKVEEERHPI